MNFCIWSEVLFSLYIYSFFPEAFVLFSLNCHDIFVKQSTEFPCYSEISISEFSILFYSSMCQSLTNMYCLGHFTFTESLDIKLCESSKFVHLFKVVQEILGLLYFQRGFRINLPNFYP